MEDVRMGFFSDLKEDLSQAVNELMPEEALDAAMADDTAPQDMLSEEQLTTEALPVEEMTESVDSVDLSSMLDKLDEMNIAEEPLEETVISPDDALTETEEMPVLEDDTTWVSGMPEQETAAMPEMAQEPEAVPEELIMPEEIIEEAVTAEEPAAEPEPVEEVLNAAEVEPDNTITGISGEEEKTMDAQTQVQTQEPVNRVAVDETAVVTEGMTITGDIVSEGSMELIGTVNGNLDIYGKLNITGTIQGDSKAAEIYAEGAKITGEVNSQGSVKIGQSSVVIGNIAAASAVIAGAVKGDIDVQGPVILDTTAIVMGNIKSKSVQINNGAVIEGMCSQCYADVNPTSFFEEFKKKNK